jgi:hypothetical protein
MKIEIYIGTEKRELEMDNFQNYLQQLMGFDRQ